MLAAIGLSEGLRKLPSYLYHLEKGLIDCLGAMPLCVRHVSQVFWTASGFAKARPEASSASPPMLQA